MTRPRAGDLEKVKALLKDNPDLVFSKDTNGWTPLHMAAYEGHKDVAELLLANKAEVNAKDNSGVTPLHLAAGNRPQGRGGIPAGQQSRGQRQGQHRQDAFALGGVGGHKSVAELLLANKAEVNAKDDNGKTPLHWAASAGSKDVAELLLANKAEVNAKENHGRTPLHLAAAEGHKDMAELLLANKAEVNAKDNHGDTPLHLAVSQGHKDVAELLRQHGGHE